MRPHQDRTICRVPFEVQQPGWVWANQDFESSPKKWFSWDSPEVDQDNSQKAAECLESFLTCFLWNSFVKLFGNESGILNCPASTNLRLSAQLLQTTWSQAELQWEGDVAKLREWSARYELFSSQQAAWVIETRYWSTGAIIMHAPWKVLNFIQKPKFGRPSLYQIMFLFSKSSGGDGFQVPERSLHARKGESSSLHAWKPQVTLRWESDNGACQYRWDASIDGSTRVPGSQRFIKDFPFVRGSYIPNKF